MASVVTFMGLICMANALFVLNYFFVRCMRLLTDSRAQIQNLHNNGNANSRPEAEESNDEEVDISGRNDLMTGAVFAFLMGGVGTHPLASKKFPNWSPIRWRMGIISSSLLMILFAFFFSESFLNDKLGLDPADTSPQKGLCKLDDREQKVRHLEQTFADETKIDDAKDQSYHTKRFYHALRADTALYGEPAYPCNRPPTTKQAFRASDSFGGSFGFHFFPGYCAAAHAYAMQQAKEQTCERTVCKGANIIQDFDVKISVEAFIPGLFGIPCVPPVIPKVRVKPIYGYEEFCQDIIVACPDFTAAEEAGDVLEDYAIEQYQYAQQLAEEQLEKAQAYLDRNRTNEEPEEGLVHELLYQIDVASNMYIGYSILALLFPVPLIIFRSAYIVAFKRFVFGYQRPCFIAIFLAVWWGVRFFQSFHLMEYYEYYQKYLKEPCIADPGYMLGALTAYTSVCDEVIELKSNWTLEASTINSTLQMVDMMKDCDCNYPYVHIKDLMPTPQEDWLEIEDRFRFGFSKPSSHMCGGETNCYVLSPNAKFLGDDTMCHNTTYVEDQILQMADESDSTWWEVWIASGILATLLVKMAAANFGLSILSLADPFSFCNGEFEWPNSQYGTRQELTELMEIKQTYLRIRSTRQACFWGLIMNLCLINIATSAFHRGGDEELDSNDVKVGATLIVMSLVPVMMGLGGFYYVNKSMAQVERAARRQLPLSARWERFWSTQ